MSFDAGSVASKLGLDISGFEGGFLRANALAAIFPQTVTNFLANPLLGLIGIAQQAGGALADIFTEANDLLDQLGDRADALGLTSEQLDRLGRVAALNGSNVESMGDAVAFLNRQVGQATNGNKEAVAGFSALGISVGQLGSMAGDPEKLLLAIADAIAALPNRASQGTAAIEVLGRGAGSLVPMLAMGSAAITKMGADAYLLGNSISAGAAVGVDKWDKAMTQLGFAWTDVKRLLAEPVRDALMPYLESMLQWVQQHPGEIKSIISSVAGTVQTVGGVVLQVLGAVGPALGAIAQNLEITFVAAAGVAVVAVRTLAREYLSLSTAIKQAGAAAAGTTFTPGAAAASGAAAAAGRGGRPNLTGVGVAAAAGGAGSVIGALLGGSNASEAIGAGVGGGLGMWGGAKAGAAAGSMAGPWGTAIGGVLGAILGGELGDKLGGSVGKSMGGSGGGAPDQQQSLNNELRVSADVLRGDFNQALRRNATEVLDTSRALSEFRAELEAVNSAAVDSGDRGTSSDAVERPGPQASGGAGLTIENLHVQPIASDATNAQIIRQLATALLPVLAQRDREFRSGMNAQAVAGAIGGVALG
jgi:hypothetical protein